jgi:hypothetical protein
MSKRLLLVGLIVCALGQRAIGDTLDAQLFPLTGEIRFHNPNGFAVPFVYYSISSITNHVGALNPTNPQWHSISDYYDASGNGFIDPINEWTKISFTSTELTEGVFVGSGSLPALRSITLGKVWNPSIVPYTNLAIAISQDTQPVMVNIQLAVAGDYDHNFTVNQADYTVWRQNFGSTTLLNADGNLNGIVDAADFAIWRKYFGSTYPGVGSSIGGGQSLGLFNSAVPEPTAGGLTCLGASSFLVRARRRRAA